MFDSLYKEAGLEASALASARGLTSEVRIRKVYQWYRGGIGSIGPVVCMILLSPFFAFLAVVFTLVAAIIKLESFSSVIFCRGADSLLTESIRR